MDQEQSSLLEVQSSINSSNNDSGKLEEMRNYYIQKSTSFSLSKHQTTFSPKKKSYEDHIDDIDGSITQSLVSFSENGAKESEIESKKLSDNIYNLKNQQTKEEGRYKKIKKEVSKIWALHDKN